MSAPDPTIADAHKREAGALLRDLCDKAGITHANRHEQLRKYIESKLKSSKEGDPLFVLRSGLPSSETLKKDLLYGVPRRPIRATELRVRLLDTVLNAGGRYVSICEKYWNALHPPQSGSSEFWYQVTFPEIDPIQGPVGRLFTAIDTAEFEAHGEDIHVDHHRIAPEDPNEFGLRWRAAGIEREGYRFLTFASLDSVRNRSFGATALRRVGDAREEHYDGYYFRPSDPAGGQPFQLERRRVAWFKSPPLGAWPRVALLDWDNTLHRGWTLVAWCEFLESEGLIPAGEEVTEKLRTLLADYPKGQSHDELAAHSSEVYANARRTLAPDDLREAAKRFVTNPRRFQPYRWVAPFLRGLTSLGIAPIIVSGAPTEVLTQWATPRASILAACFGLDAPNATSVALPNEFLAAIVPGQINPATTHGKQYLVDQLKRTKRRIVLAVGDSVSDSALWEAAENGIYVGTVVRPVEDQRRSLVMEDPTVIEHEELVGWVYERVGMWSAAEWSEVIQEPNSQQEIW
jgi:phosphoserine phosphatase